MKNAITLKLSLPLAVLLSLGASACGDDGGEVPQPDSGPNTKDSGFVDFDTGVVPTDTGVTDTGVVDSDAGLTDAGTPTDCSHNPNGCVTNQLRSAPPACACLAGCEAGFNWTGAACEPATPADGGTPDSGEPADSGTPADGGDPADSGPPADGGDPADAGPADTGAVVDGGGLDAGDLPDAGFGFGLTEGDACNPQAPNCRQRPGLVCQSLELTNPASTNGICLAACDLGANTGSGNPACTGIGQDCADAFDLGPTNGRCVNTVGPFEVLAGERQLEVCDPGPGNLVFIASDPNVPGSPGVCWPTCLARASNTNPDPNPPTCDSQGPYTSCNDEIPLGGDPANPADNVYGLCNSVGTRDNACGADRGIQCPGTDLCLFGICRQSLGATCTGAPACAGAGQVCVEIAAGTAVCHQPCGINTGTPACAVGQACDLFSLGGQPFQSCRLASGNLGHEGDCSDILGIGTNSSDCGPGTFCMEAFWRSCTGDGDCPFGQFCQGGSCTGYGEAYCFSYCDPAVTPDTCNTPYECTPLGAAPFDAFGLCF